MKDNQKRKRKKRRRKVLPIVINLLLLAILAAAAYLFLSEAASSLFLKNTTLNGYDVSEKTPEQALQILTQDFDSLTLEIKEQGETVLTVPLTELGCTVDQTQLLTNLQSYMDNQRLQLLINLFTSNQSEVEIPITVDEQAFQEIISVKNLSGKRISSQDAELIFEDGTYSIKPEVYGNEFDDASLRSLVKEALSNADFSGNTQSLITVEVPRSLYKPPSKTSDDPEMNRLMNIYNKFCKASVTYLFGDEKEVLDWDTIQDWLIIDGDDASVDEERVYDYVVTMAEKYDTIYSLRTFTSSNGYQVTLDYNNYGYLIDQDGEFSQLLANINSNLAVEREPIYSIRGFSRNGVDDLNGNYVEVDLTNQYIWFYRNGGLVVSSPVVTGTPKPETETATGAFPIAYKASPFNLKGGGSNGVDSWDVEVQYWMPFHDGQGLHDASWRGAFGGSIYMTGGSHGCVNLPLDVAAAIYNDMEAGIPILLYK